MEYFRNTKASRMSLAEEPSFPRPIVPPSPALSRRTEGYRGRIGSVTSSSSSPKMLAHTPSFFTRNNNNTSCVQDIKATLGHVSRQSEVQLHVQQPPNPTVELTSVEIQNFNKMFEIFDTDQSGAIDIHEIGNLMVGLGFTMTKEELEELVKEVDIDGSKELDKDEFLTLMRKFKIAKGDFDLMATVDRAEHMERAMHSFLPPFTTFSDTRWRWVWDSIILCVTFYYCVVSSPITWVWDLYEEEKNLLFTDYICTAVLLADMVIWSRTLTFDETSKMRNKAVTSASLLRAYVTSDRFPTDIMSTIPVDILLRAGGLSTASKVASHLKLLRLLTVTKLWGGQKVSSMRVSRIFIRFHFDFLPMVRMWFWVAVVIHWLASMWLIVVLSNDETKDDESLNKYHIGVYWVLYTLATTGYGDITIKTKGQHYYASFVIALGAVLNAVLIGRLTGELLRPNVATSGHSRLRMTLDVLQFLQVPGELQEDILSFLAHNFENDIQAFDYLFDSLPTQMRSNLDLHLKLKCLAPVGIFTFATQECRIEIASLLQSEMYAPDEFVIVSGQNAGFLYLLAHGYCDIVRPTEGYQITIQKGDYFGEKELLIGGKFDFSVKTLTFAELYQLSRTSFKKVLSDFPGFQEEVQKIIDAEKLLTDQAEMEDAGCFTDNEPDDTFISRRSSVCSQPSAVVASRMPSSSFDFGNVKRMRMPKDKRLSNEMDTITEQFSSIEATLNNHNQLLHQILKLLVGDPDLENATRKESNSSNASAKKRTRPVNKTASATRVRDSNITTSSVNPLDKLSRGSLSTE